MSLLTCLINSIQLPLNVTLGHWDFEERTIIQCISCYILNVPICYKPNAYMFDLSTKCDRPSVTMVIRSIRHKAFIGCRNKHIKN